MKTAHELFAKVRKIRIDHPRFAGLTFNVHAPRRGEAVIDWLRRCANRKLNGEQYEQLMEAADYLEQKIIVLESVIPVHMIV